jgi:rhamnogalacturonyl hydrolase YesR
MIVDKGGQNGNWIDPSGTGMFTYFIQKGVELGLLDKAEYEGVARRGWEALQPFAKINDSGLVDIRGGGDGIGIMRDFNSYVSVRRQVNAKETVGAFLWASAIMEQPELEKTRK